jgi:hypothetical protein
MPNANKRTGRLEKSVHRSDGLTPSDIWALGRNHVENPSKGRIIKARCVGVAQAVIGKGLSFDISGEPFPRHADIVGWPSAKEKQKMLATELAVAFALELAPTATS